MHNMWCHENFKFLRAYDMFYAHGRACNAPSHPRGRFVIPCNNLIYSLAHHNVRCCLSEIHFDANHYIGLLGTAFSAPRLLCPTTFGCSAVTVPYRRSPAAVSSAVCRSPSMYKYVHNRSWNEWLPLVTSAPPTWSSSAGYLLAAVIELLICTPAKL